MTSSSRHWFPERVRSLLHKGDTTEFDEIVRTFWEPVMRFFWKRTDPTQAEDLTQDVFAALVRVLRKGGGPSRGEAEYWRRFLMTCARNRIISYWRYEGVRPPVAAMTEFLGEETTHSGIPNAERADVAGPEQMLTQEQGDAIRDCLGELEALPRFACWLVLAEGRSKRETGRLLEMPEATVRSTISVAIQYLRRCLEGKGMAPPA